MPPKPTLGSPVGELGLPKMKPGPKKTHADDKESKLPKQKIAMPIKSMFSSPVKSAPVSTPGTATISAPEVNQFLAQPAPSPSKVTRSSSQGTPPLASVRAGPSPATTRPHPTSPARPDPTAALALPIPPAPPAPDLDSYIRDYEKLSREELQKEVTTVNLRRRALLIVKLKKDPEAATVERERDGALKALEEEKAQKWKALDAVKDIYLRKTQAEKRRLTLEAEVERKKMKLDVVNRVMNAVTE